jgi:hypothetical protein
MPNTIVGVQTRVFLFGRNIQEVIQKAPFDGSVRVMPSKLGNYIYLTWRVIGDFNLLEESPSLLSESKGMQKWKS